MKSRFEKVWFTGALLCGIKFEELGFEIHKNQVLGFRRSRFVGSEDIGFEVQEIQVFGLGDLGFEGQQIQVLRVSRTRFLSSQRIGFRVQENYVQGFQVIRVVGFRKSRFCGSSDLGSGFQENVFWIQEIKVLGFRRCMFWDSGNKGFGVRTNQNSERIKLCYQGN